ncbi:MAG: 3-oxoacyl-ACP synthase III family protein [Candidatus Njordarchaeia archaeon]
MEIKRYAKIVEAGIALPEKVVTNDDYEKEFGVPLPDAWRSALEERIGITLRYVADENTSPSDLSVAAIKNALERANLDIDDIDLIIQATDTPDYQTPPSCTVIHKKLGAKVKTGCFDINAACADNTIGLNIASQMIMMNEDMNYVVVVSPYTMNRFIDRKTDIVGSIFSDGAGAVIVGPSDEPGYITGKIIADGTYWDYWGIYIGGARPCTEKAVKEGHNYLRYIKRYPPDVNIRHWPDLILQTAEKAGIDVKDIKHFLITQVNKQTIMDTLKVLGLPPERGIYVMGKYGYTGSACVFFALYDAINEGRFKKGDYLIFVTSGVGFVMASALFKWV